jgi:hypothetical protein
LQKPPGQLRCHQILFWTGFGVLQAEEEEGGFAARHALFLKRDYMDRFFLKTFSFVTFIYLI